MVKKSLEKENCPSSFTTLLKRNEKLIKHNKVDEVLVSDNRNKPNELSEDL
jgi:hypothetical protein